MFSINMFRSAGATGHVLTRSGGTTKDRGIGWSGLIGPTAIVGVVPTTPQIVHFSVEVYTSDKQVVRVAGSVQAQLDPKRAFTTFDFTVNRNNGHYEKPWQPDLQAMVAEQALGPIRATAAGLQVDQAVTAQSAFEQSLRAEFSRADNLLVAKGISVLSCSVTIVEAANPEVAKAIGAREREALLSASDKALHDRRYKAATNDRALKEYEAETKLGLEESRTALVAKEGENLVAQAKSQAEADRIQLEHIESLDASRAMASAFLIAAQKGTLNSVSLTTDLLASLKQATQTEA